MTMNAPQIHEAKSRAATQVAEWRLEIQSFFDDDWCRLRTLIRNLEEQSWDDGSSDSLHCDQGDRQIALQSPVTDDRSGTRSNQDQIDCEPKPAVRDRLAELAEQIERRLQTANTDGKQTRGSI